MVIFAGGQWRNACQAPLPRGLDNTRDIPLPHTDAKHAVMLPSPVRDSNLPVAKLPQAPVPHLLSSAPTPTPLPLPKRAQQVLGSSGVMSVTLDRLVAGMAVGGCGTTESAAGDRHPDNPSTTASTNICSRGAARDVSPDPAALTSWIKGSRSMHRLCRIIRQFENIMNHIHISAMITHLSQLADDDPATAALLSAVGATPDTTPPRSPPQGTRLRHRSSAASVPTSIAPPAGTSSSTPTVFHSASPSSPPSSGPATSYLQSQPGASLGASGTCVVAATDAADMRDLVAALLRLLHQSLQHFEPRQLANTAWALGKWPAAAPGRDLALAAVVNATSDKLLLFRPQELVNLLYGYTVAATSVMGAVPTAACVTAPLAIGSTATATAATARPAAVGTMPAGAAARSEFSPPPPPRPAAAFLRDHARACAVQLRQGRFKMQELSSLLWAWGNLLGSCAGGHGSGAGDGSVLWVPHGGGAPAAAQVYGLQLPYREVLDAQLRLDLATAGPQELANSVHGLARLQVPPPLAWLEAFLLACRRHLRAAGSPSVGRGAGSSQRSGKSNRGPRSGAADTSQPQPRRLQGTASRATPTQADPGPRPREGFNPQELSILLWGCSKLRLRLPPAFLDDVAPALERCLPHMDLQERVNVMWALTWQVKLGAAGWELWEACEEEDARPKVEAVGLHGRDDGVGGRSGGTGTAQPELLLGLEQTRACGTSVSMYAEASWHLGPGPGLGLGQQPTDRPVSLATEQARDANKSNDLTRMAVAGSASARTAGGARGGQLQAAVPTSPPQADCEHGTQGTTAEGRPCDAAGQAAPAADDRVPPPAPYGSQRRDLAPPAFQRLTPSVPSVTSGGATYAGGLRQQQAQRQGPRNQPQGGGLRLGPEGQRSGPGFWSGPHASPALPLEAMPRSRAPVEKTEPLLPPPLPDGRASEGAAVQLPILRRVVLAVLDGARRAEGAGRGTTGTRPRLPGCQDVSMSMWSLATLSGVFGGALPSPPPQQQQQRRRHGRMDDMFDSPDDVPGCRQRAGQPTAAALLVDEAEAEPLLRLWWRLLPDMSPQGQANCVWAAGRLGRQLPPELMGGLAAWLRAHAAALLPSEAAAVARGLGALSLRAAPSRPIVTAIQAVLEQAYLQGSKYGMWELVQVCYGGAQVIRSLSSLPHTSAVGGGGGGGSDSSSDGMVALATGANNGGGGGGINGKPSAAPLPLPAATEIRMSLDLDYDDGFGPSAASPVRKLQRQLTQPLDRLLLQLQWSYRLGSEPELEEVAMTLAAVGLVLRAQVSDARALELSAWCQDLARQHVRRALAQQPYNVRRLAPLLYQCTAMAVGAVRAARARSRAAMERRRSAAAAAAGRSAQSSIDEFLRSGRLAERRLELQQMRRGELRMLQQQQQEEQGRGEWVREQEQEVQERAQSAERCVSDSPLKVQQDPQQQQGPRPAARPGGSTQVTGATGNSAPVREGASGAAWPQTPSVAPDDGVPGQQRPFQVASPPPPSHGGLAPPQPQSPAWAACGLSLESLQRFWAASRPHLGELYPSEAAMLLWSFAVLTAQPPDAWWRELLAVVYPHLCAAGVATASAPATASAGKDATLDGEAGGSRGVVSVVVSDRSLALLLWGLGHLRLTPPAEWMAVTLAAVEVRTARGSAEAGGGFDRDAIVGLLCGLAELGWPLPEGWLSRVVRGMAPQLLQMDARQRGLAYQAVVGIDPGLADRLGYEFSELVVAAGGEGGTAGNSVGVESMDEGAGQRRALFSRSRGGW